MISAVSTTSLSTTVRLTFSSLSDLSTGIREFFYAIFHTTVDGKNRAFSAAKAKLSTVYTLISYFIIVVLVGGYRAGSTDVDIRQTGWAQ